MYHSLCSFLEVHFYFHRTLRPKNGWVSSFERKNYGIKSSLFDLFMIRSCRTPCSNCQKLIRILTHGWKWKKKKKCDLGLVSARISVIPLTLTLLILTGIWLKINKRANHFRFLSLDKKTISKCVSWSRVFDRD